MVVLLEHPIVSKLQVEECEGYPSVSLFQPLYEMYQYHSPEYDATTTMLDSRYIVLFTHNYFSNHTVGQKSI